MRLSHSAVESAESLVFALSQKIRTAAAERAVLEAREFADSEDVLEAYREVIQREAQRLEAPPRKIPDGATVTAFPFPCTCAEAPANCRIHHPGADEKY